MPLSRTRGAVLAALAAFLVSPSASATLRIKWDCYLPNANVDCGVLRSSLTSKIPFITTVSDESEADVVVTITSVSA